MQRNSIISLPQLLLYFSIILNIWSHPFMLVPHVSLWCLLTGMPSVLFGFHPIGHFSFLECSKFPWSHSLPRCYFPCLKFVLHLNPGLRRFNLWTSTQLLLWKAFPDTQVLVRVEAPRQVLKGSACDVSLDSSQWKQELCVFFSPPSSSRNLLHASQLIVGAQDLLSVCKTEKFLEASRCHLARHFWSLCIFGDSILYFLGWCVHYNQGTI